MLSTLNGDVLNHLYSYAKRIRKVWWSSQKHDGQLLTLLQISSWSPLFPHLQHVSVDTFLFKTGDFPDCSHLFTQALQSFELTASADPCLVPAQTTISLHTCISSLSIRSPQLRTLNIVLYGYFPFESIQDWPLLSRLFHQLRWLEEIKLNIEEMPFHAFFHLATLPNIKRLIIMFQSSEPQGIVAYEIPSTSTTNSSLFPGLEVLNIDATSYCSSITGLEWKRVGEICKDSPLKQVDIRLVHTSPSSIQTIIDAISSPTSILSSGLWSLITLDDEDNYEYVHEVMLTEFSGGTMKIFHLQALSTPRYQALTVLKLRWMHYSDLEDGDIATLGSWLPRLITLSLVYCCPGDKPKLTIMGVVNLTKYCPKLIELALSVALYPMDESLKESIGYTPWLKEWHLADSYAPETSVKEVAFSLAKLFPSLGSVDYHSHNLHSIKTFLENTAALRRSATDLSLLDDSILEGYWNED